MLCLGHFCEIHGPTSVLVTQALYPSQAIEEIPSGVIPDPKPSENGSSSGNDRISNGFSKIYDGNNLLSSGSHCASCILTFPRSQTGENMGPVTSMRTIKDEPSGDKIVYLSIQTPTDQERYTIIRQSCLKILSSEHTFNDSMPVVISDPGQGTSLGIVFKVHDDMSRGHFRKYVFICHCDNEQMLMSSFMLITGHLNVLKTYIQQRASKEYEREESIRKASAGSDWFIRAGRESKKNPPRGLTSILKDDQFFGQLHSQFTYLLSSLNKKYRFSH